MGELSGTWTPSSDDEFDFLTRMNTVVQDAYYGRGIPQAEIAGALAFMAASVAMSEPSEDAPPMPEPPDKPDDCPNCGATIDSVAVFMGGDCVVQPCGCHVHMDRLGEWVERPEVDDG